MKRIWSTKGRLRMSLNKSALLSQTRLEISAGNVAEHVPFKLTSTYVKELRAAIVLLSFFS